MRLNLPSFRTTLLATGLTVLLAGCIVVPRGRYYGGADSGVVVSGGGAVVDSDTYVTVAPPLPQVEVQLAIPGPNFFWIGGHWLWGGSGYRWAPGRWEQHRPGYGWAPHRWERRGNGWAQQGGRWERRH